MRRTRSIGGQWVVRQPDALGHPVVGVSDDGRGGVASSLAHLLCGFLDEHVFRVLDPLLLATVGLAAAPGLLARFSGLGLVREIGRRRRRRGRRRREHRDGHVAIVDLLAANEVVLRRRERVDRP